MQMVFEEDAKGLDDWMWRKKKGWIVASLTSWAFCYGMASSTSF